MNYGSKINISNLLGGISGFLNTANKIIPIYNEAKPLINHINKIRKTIKKFNLPEIFKNFSINNANSQYKENDLVQEKRVTNNSYSNPQFFL